MASALLAVSVFIGSVPADADGHLELVAEGLDNPRGLAVKGGRIYVAEAGRGGPVLVDTPLGGGPGPICVGNTGAISEIVDGAVQKLISLPSAADAVGGACDGPGFGVGATGPHAIDVQGRQWHYSVGLGGDIAARDALSAALPEASLLGTVTDRRGRREFLRDVAALEAAQDPAGDGVDSNPYGLTRGRSAEAIVADAGGNSLIELRRTSTNVLATFAPRCVPWTLPFPNPIPPDSNPCGDQSLFPAQAVPTDVALDSDGDYLVTTLGGFPFVPGYSVVYEVDRDFVGTASCSLFDPIPAAGCTVFADGLTALVGIDIAPDGKVYVVQIADEGILALEQGGSDAGSVQVLARTTGELVGSIEGLNAPGGVDIHRGRVYITNFSILPGAGQIVKTRLVR